LVMSRPPAETNRRDCLRSACKLHGCTPVFAHAAALRQTILLTGTALVAEGMPVLDERARRGGLPKPLRVSNSTRHSSLKARNGSIESLSNKVRNSKGVLLGEKYVSIIVRMTASAFWSTGGLDRTRIRLIKA
jgi:hypothetical protein